MKKYEAYVEQGKMWESHVNGVAYALFDSIHEAEIWINNMREHISDSEDIFVLDWGIKIVDDSVGQPA